MIYTQDFKTTLEDIDKNAYITNKAILRFFENTATYHSDSIGGGIKAVEETGLTWIVLDWRVKVINRPKYGEKLKVRTWSRGIQKFFAFRDYELVNDNDEILALGTSKWVLMDINKNRMVLLNDELMARYESEDRPAFDENQLSKIESPSEFSNEINYTVMRKDIDFNKHMHNLYHFDLAYEVLPGELYENSTFDNFRITYKIEIKLGETVTCKYSLLEDKNIVVISDLEGNTKSIIKLW